MHNWNFKFETRNNFLIILCICDVLVLNFNLRSAFLFDELDMSQLM